MCLLACWEGYYIYLFNLCVYITCILMSDVGTNHGR